MAPNIHCFVVQHKKRKKGSFVREKVYPPARQQISIVHLKGRRVFLWANVGLQQKFVLGTSVFRLTKCEPVKCLSMQKMDKSSNDSGY